VAGLEKSTGPISMKLIVAESPCCSIKHSESAVSTKCPANESFGC
jgi:hypothetical protein